MEIAQNFVSKYATVDVNTCANESLEQQFASLVGKCEKYNNGLQQTYFGNKVQKIKLANEISILLRMRVISEQRARDWAADRQQIRKDLDNFKDNLVVMADSSRADLQELKLEADDWKERNSELEKQIEQHKVKCASNETLIHSLNDKLTQMQELVTSLKRELLHTNSLLIQKKNYILSICEQKAKTCDSANVCTITDDSTCSGVQLADVSSPTVLTIQDKLRLCQILGDFDSLESPVRLSNQFEAVVCQYSLNDGDACALLRAWLPGPLATRIVLENCGCVADAGGRRQEVHRVLGSRDERGVQALASMRFMKGMDPVIFCHEYISLYRVVHNCQDISSDDGELLYSMAKKCLVSRPVKLALKNAITYQQFINILRDCCEEGNEGETSNVSVAYKGTQRNIFRCYRCHRPGHIKRYCRSHKVKDRHTSNISNCVSTVSPHDHEKHENVGAFQGPDKLENRIWNCGQQTNSKEFDNVAFGAQGHWPNIPVYAPLASMPYWLICSLSNIAIPFFLGYMEECSKINV
ncbi:posterior protein-like [Hyperolius riggenbachi]|uniref:posterior protein-like n=1 Tax=Hyperolius riggenbachi TaxID=752182 RepID=UPI0035A28FEA